MDIVGIGTDNPLGKFVVSNGGAEGIEFFPGSASGQNSFQHYNRSGSAYLRNRNIASEFTFNLSGASADAVTFKAGGNVGIGDDNPSDKFVVKGDAASIGVESADMQVALLGKRSSSGVGLDQGYLRLRNQGVTADGAVVDSAGPSFFNGGNVGIGITDPDQALEIGAGGKLKLSRADNSRSMLLYTNNADCVIQSDTDPLHLQSANRMTFATNGASERMRIDTSGNVGIGTAAPTHGLTVSDDTGGDDANFRRITIKSATHGVNSGFRFDSESANGTARGGGYYFQPGDTDATTYLGLTASDSAYQMVVTRDGNVAIGTTEVANANSSLTIDVNQSSNNARGLHFYGGADVTNKYISIGRTHTAGNHYINSEVRFGAEVGGQGQSFLSFATGTGNPNETTGNPERMRIDSDGRLAIGNTTTAADADIPDNIKLVVAGGVIVGSAAGNDNSFLGYRDIGGLTVLQGSGNYGLRIFDDNSTTPRFQVNRSGNVGIGTAVSR